MKSKKSKSESKNKKENKKIKKLLEILIILLIAVDIVLVYGCASFGMNITQAKKEELNFESNSIDDVYSLTKYNRPIVLFMESDGCHFCQEMKPTVESLYNRYKGKVIIKQVNVEKNLNVRKAFNANSYPDLIFINGDGTAYEPNEEFVFGFNYGKDNTGKTLYTKHVGKLEEDQIEEIIADMLVR